MAYWHTENDGTHYFKRPRYSHADMNKIPLKTKQRESNNDNYSPCDMQRKKNSFKNSLFPPSQTHKPSDHYARDHKLNRNLH